MPGLGPYIAAGLLAWPVARLVAQTNRWQGAGVIAAVGMVYAAAVTATLHYWILTEEEKQKGIKLLRQVLGGFRSRGQRMKHRIGANFAFLLLAGSCVPGMLFSQAVEAPKQNPAQALNSQTQGQPAGQVQDCNRRDSRTARNRPTRN